MPISTNDNQSHPPAPLLAAPARDDADDAALIAAYLARWPDMARYAATARVEPCYDSRADVGRRGAVVTVYRRVSEAQR